MGSGIAHVCALAGFEVRSATSSRRRSTKAPSPSIDRNITRQVAKGKVSRGRQDAALARIKSGTGYDALRRLRPRHRGGHRARGAQARDLQEAGPAPRGARDHRVQHLVDLDHAARRGDRPAGTLHRHAFHESGAGDGAGRADPRHRDRRADLRSRPDPGRTSSARRPSPPRTSRPSSSTASCCR